MDDFTDGSGVGAQDTFYRDASWKLKFAWFPYRCAVTGQKIWFKRAYCGTRQFRVDNHFMFDRRWIERDVWMIEKLKGTI